MGMKGVAAVSDAAAYTDTVILPPGVTQAQINNAVPTSGGGTVQLPAGEIEIDLIDHPNATGGFGKVGIVLRRGVTLRGAGAGLTTIKLVDGAALGTGSQNRMVTNWDMDGEESGGDYDIHVEDLTIDGNAANVGAADKVCHGIQLWRVENSRYERVVAKNCRGNDTSTYETFHLDWVRCTGNLTARDCQVFTDDAGETATGFSANFCTNVLWDNCLAHDMANGHGFTVARCDYATHLNCTSDDNGGNGFNCEGSWDVAHIGNAASGNTVSGLVVNTSAGGGNFQGAQNTYRANGRGVGVTGSFTFTAAVGTTGSTIVGPASTFTDQMVGRWIAVGANGYVRIATYVDDTTVTTSSAHGGAATDAVLVQAGYTRLSAAIFDNTGGGVEILDSTAALKLLTCYRTDVSDSRFGNNGNDFLGVGNGSTSTIAAASGKIADSLLSNVVSTVIFRNPFPFRIALVIVATGTTELGGKEPNDTTTSSVGSQSGSWTIPVGGLFKPTVSAATNVRAWMQF